MSAEAARTRIMQSIEINSASGCWIWTGKPRADGYGRLRFEGKQWGAHRLSFTVFKGPIPAGLLVCHTCDRPLCVNPEHLFIGTESDNAKDAATKGRTARGERNGHVTQPERTRRGASHYRVGNRKDWGIGEKNGRHKLTIEQVREIRALEGKVTMTELARRYGVSKTNILNIWIGKIWSKVS